MGRFEGGTDTGLERMAAQPLDVLIVGGGIVGAGVARDAAMRGLRVGLVEKHDLASGTSGRSSRLLHGGLRYLAQGRLGLVHEASSREDGSPPDRPAPGRAVAVSLPDLSRHAVAALETGRGREALRPALRSAKPGPIGNAQSRGRAAKCAGPSRGNRLTGAVRYFDGLTNDARLVLDTLGSAARQGAIVLNYVGMVDATPRSKLAMPHPRRGATGPAAKNFVPARCVVNAAGPWAAAIPHSSVRLRLTKGVHLVIDRDAAADAQRRGDSARARESCSPFPGASG